MGNSMISPISPRIPSDIPKIKGIRYYYRNVSPSFKVGRFVSAAENKPKVFMLVEM